MSKEVEFKNRDRFIQLGLTIAALRKMQGMSQEQLAEKANISRSHLSSIEAPNIIRPFSLEAWYINIIIFKQSFKCGCFTQSKHGIYHNDNGTNCLCCTFF